MNRQQFQEHIQKKINTELYIEDSSFNDIDRIMYTYQNKPYYVCAFPKNGVREEFDPNYVSERDQAFPKRADIESKVRTFVEQLPNDLELYEQ